DQLAIDRRYGVAYVGGGHLQERREHVGSNGRFDVKTIVAIMLPTADDARRTHRAVWKLFCNPCSLIARGLEYERCLNGDSLIKVQFVRFVFEDYCDSFEWRCHLAE